MMKNNISQIIDAITYLNQFHRKTFLIKVGGSILDDHHQIASLCFDLKLLKQSGVNVIIVHGGSKAIHQSLSDHNIVSQFIDGLRVTSLSAMKIIEMVLCGHVNKLLVRKLNQLGIQAIGLSGSDNNMLVCDYYSDKHGQVGVIHSINTAPIMQLLSNPSPSFDAVPIIAPVGVNAVGNAMNINADYAASQLAIALKVDKLIYLTDQDGIYDKNKNIFSELTREELMTLIDKKMVYGGMLIKAKAILMALDNHLNHIHILNGNKPHVLIEELLTINGIGTLCKIDTTVQNSLEVTP